MSLTVRHSPFISSLVFSFSRLFCPPRNPSLHGMQSFPYSFLVEWQPQGADLAVLYEDGTGHIFGLNEKGEYTLIGGLPMAANWEEEGEVEAISFKSASSFLPSSPPSPLPYYPALSYFN